MTSATDLKHIRRAVVLAREALEAGDAPFGSVLVSGDGKVLAEDRNRTSSGDATRHPEFELALSMPFPHASSANGAPSLASPALPSTPCRSRTSLLW
jgi:hypothetical protein